MKDAMIKPSVYVKFFLLAFCISSLSAMEVGQRQEDEELNRSLTHCDEEVWALVSEMAGEANDSDYCSDLESESDRVFSYKDDSQNVLLASIIRLNEVIGLQKQALQEIENSGQIQLDGDAHSLSDWQAFRDDEESENVETSLLTGVKRSCDARVVGQAMSKRPKTHSQKKDQSKKSLTCDEVGCNLTFTTKGNLNKHKNTVHSEKRPFRCDEAGCKSAFKVKADLSRHKRYKHSDERPFQCDELGCNKASKSKGDLLKHKIYKHSDERPFKCGQAGCDSAFKSQSNLNLHKKCKHA